MINRNKEYVIEGEELEIFMKNLKKEKEYETYIDSLEDMDYYIYDEYACENYEIYEERESKFLEKVDNNFRLKKAYKILEKTERINNKKKAIFLARLSYKISHDCFNAIIIQSILEDDNFKREKLLKDALKYEEERLKKEGYFKSKRGKYYFYNNKETRLYIIGLNIQVKTLVSMKKYKQALNICDKILRLDRKDHTNTRYLAMLLCAILKEEKHMISIYNNYKEESFKMLFPFIILYYKKNNHKKVKYYIDRIDMGSPYLIDLCKHKIEFDEPPKYNILNKDGTLDEITSYFIENSFLEFHIKGIDKFIILNYSKRRHQQRWAKKVKHKNKKKKNKPKKRKKQKKKLKEGVSI